MGGGVRQSIGFKEIRNMNIPLPPRPEQDQIVRYLDWKVSMINKYINAKKRQIELLKERKQAIINQAVTKGLDSKVPVKDSGIEWLGKIPAHWEVKQLSRVANVILSGLDKKSYPNEKGVKLCNYVDVYRNDFIHRNMDFMDATANENEYVNLLLKKGDVIITKDSESWDDIAVPAIVIQDLVNICCGYHLAILRCKDSDLDPLYLYYIFQTRFVEIQQKLRAKGVIRFSLGYQSIHDTNIIIPPLSEQFNIATYLKKDIENINQLISFATNEIQFIHEYRIRLISDVVTGKVNVQNIKIPNYTPYTPEILNSEFDNSMLKGNLND
jgi:type I restriction enzyme S subunit